MGYRRPSTRTLLRTMARIAANRGDKQAAKVASLMHNLGMAQARSTGRWGLRAMIGRTFFNLTPKG